jgi:hypothetical protein
MRTILALVALAATGCTTPKDRGWVSDRLYLGRALPAGGMVDDRAWAAFVRDEVSPRFPRGLTIWRADGQWRGPGGVTHEPVMVIEVVQPRDVVRPADFAEVAVAYKHRFQQEAVLHVSSAAGVRMLR